MQGHVYHWKHGWIPLDHLAARIKAKGSTSGMHRYVSQYGITDHRAPGGERRKVERAAGDVKATDRGGFEYRKGTRTKDYPQRGGSAAPAGPKSADEAFGMGKKELEPHAAAGNRHAQDELNRRAAKHGRPAPYGTAPKPAPEAPKPAPEAPKFGPTPQEKADNAAKMYGHGSPQHRKALKDAGLPYRPVERHPEAPKPAPDLTPPVAPRHPDAPAPSEADLTAAHEAENRRIEAALGNGDSIKSAVAGDLEVHSHYGPANASGNRDHLGMVGKTAEGRYTAVSPYAKTEHGSLGTFDNRLDAHRALAAQLPRKAVVSDAPVDDTMGHATRKAAEAWGFGSAQHVDYAQTHANQIAERLGTGHSIKVSSANDYAWSAEGGSVVEPKIHARHYLDGTGGIGGARLIGEVRHGEGGSYEATARTYTDRMVKGRLKTDHMGSRTDLGSFGTQEEAHRAIAKHHAAHQAALDAKAAKKVQAAERKKALVGEVEGPGGTTWKPYDAGEGMSPLAAAQVRSKSRQAYKAGDHTVVIETELSGEQTKGLLRDVTNATNRATPNLKGTGVKFLVPTGETWTKDGGVVGAYVHVNGTTVHINPKVADNSLAESFARGGHTGHFTPAAKSIPAREYTILHELGHVVDNVHGHTPGALKQPKPGHRDSLGNKVNFTDRWAPGAEEFHGKAALTSYSPHSKYGRSNPAEGYAEAFAQHSVGGPGSHPVADHYAAHFGWKTGGETTDQRALRENRDRAMARYGAK